MFSIVVINKKKLKKDDFRKLKTNDPVFCVIILNYLQLLKSGHRKHLHISKVNLDNQKVIHRIKIIKIFPQLIHFR